MPPLHRAAGGILRALRLGSGEGLRDLTTAARGAWMAAHAEAVAALTRALPILCCASAVPAEARGPDARYRPLARWIERRGAGPNDGLVPVRSALLPGTRHLVVEGSHRGLVAAGRGRDPVGVLRSALTLVLRDTAAGAHAPQAAGAASAGPAPTPSPPARGRAGSPAPRRR